MVDAVPNQKTPAPPFRTRPTIGLLTGNTWDSISRDMWAGVEAVAREHDANLIRFAGDDLSAPFEHSAQANIIYDLVSSETIDGLVVWGGGLGQYIEPAEVQAFCEGFRPLPVVNAALPLQGIPSILVDNYQGMREVITHLIVVHHHQRIVFVRGPEGHPEADARLQAYIDVLTEHDLAFDAALIVPGDFNPNSGRAAIRLLLDERKLLPGIDFDALACVSDGGAIAAMTELQLRDIQVPQDIAVTGFDNIQQGWYATPSLTTAPCLAYEQGRQASELLLKLLQGDQGPERVILPTRLVIRESCGCPSPALVQPAPPPTDRSSEYTVEEILASNRDQIIVDMVHAVEDTCMGVTGEGVERLLDAFVAELTQESVDSFRLVLTDVLPTSSTNAGNVSAWQGAITVLRRHVADYLEDDLLARAEDLWQEARVLIGETGQRLQVAERLQVEARSQAMAEVSQSLLAPFDVTQLEDAVIDALAHLGIEYACISLYQNPDLPTEEAEVLIAYDERGQLELDSEERHFPAQQLVPQGFLPTVRRHSTVIEPLFLRENQLGFAVLQANPQDALMHIALRGLISSALKGTLLINEREQAEQALKRRAAQLAMINEIGGQVSSVLEVDTLLQKAAALVQASFGFHQVAFLTLDRDKNELVRRAHIGSSPNITFTGQRQSIDLGMIGWTAREGQTLLSNDVRTDPHHTTIVRETIETRSELSIPLRIGDEVIGVFDIQSPHLDAFSANDVMAMETLASQVAVAIENARLYRELRIRAEGLEIANRITQATNKELEAFSYSVSHDLRAPLRHIGGFVHFLSQRERDTLDPTSLRYLERIAEAVEKMGRLIDDLLALSQTGRVAMQTRRVDLEQLVSEAQQELANDLEQRTIAWQIAPLPAVDGDPALLRQVLVNLLSNAIKFTAPRSDPRIEIGVLHQDVGAPDGRVCLYIQDNGVGFDPQYAHKLFGVFQRLHHDDEFEGTGIGLATVRRIIHRHGGQTWAEGRTGYGATFYFTLPLHRPTESNEPPA